MPEDASRAPKAALTLLHPGMLLSLLLFLGYVLRLYHLDVKDIWVDEAHIWWHARLPLLESLSRGMAEGPTSVASDPLYGVLMHFWIELTGESVFAMRYFSVLAYLITLALLGWAAGRAFGMRARLAAMVIGAVSPLWVLYSQEIRPYALVPAAMLLVVCGIVDIAQGRGNGWRGWSLLVAGEVMALYTHGFLAFGLLTANLLLVWMGLRHLRWPDWRHWWRSWAISRAATLALTMPLIPLYLARSGAVINPLFLPLSASEFAAALWGYLLGIPWEQRAEGIPMVVPVAGALLLSAVALAIALRQRGARLLADWMWWLLGTATLIMIYSWRNAAFHGRYALFLSGVLFLILAALIATSWEARRWGRFISGGLALALLISSLMGLQGLYSGAYSGYRHHATRAVSEALKEQFGPQDGVIVMPVYDYTLEYYGHGEATLGWAHSQQAQDTPQGLLEFMRGKNKIGVLRLIYENEALHSHIPFYLERFGSLVSRQLFEGYTLSTYRLDHETQWEMADFEPAHVSWGTLRLSGQSIASGDAITVALQFRTAPDYTPGPRYALSLRLVDPMTNWALSQMDSLLVDEHGRPASAWQPDEQFAQYFVLPLQPGTPPLEAHLVAVLYDAQTGEAVDLRDASGAPAGREALLASVVLGPAPARWVYADDQRAFALTPLPSDVLAGYAPDRSVVAPAERLGVTLGWLIPPEVVRERGAEIQLVQDGLLLAWEDGPPLQGRQPADVPAGGLWLDRRVLEVGREARSGPADLIVRLGDQRITLGSVEIAGFERLNERPAVEHTLEATFGEVAQLLGYRLEVPPRITSEATLTLTLYWQALADGTPEVQYKVFTHMLNPEGRLVGQHDGVPVDGTRPFSGWQAGEYLIDVHPMRFIAPYEGVIHIQVGLYDPATLERILTADGRDAVMLPLELVVESKR